MTLYDEFSPFLANIGPRNGGGGMKKSGYGSGRQTLRFKSNGEAKVEDVDEVRTIAEERINQLLENFLGINDEELSKMATHTVSCLNSAPFL